MELKYLLNGAAVQVVGKADNGQFLVQEAYQNYDGEMAFDSVIVVDAVYDNAPTQILDDKIAKLEEQINQKQILAKELQSEIIDYQKQIKEFERNKAKYPDLSCVLDIADGKECYVVFDGSLEIKKYPEECKDRDKELRSLVWCRVWDGIRSKMQLYIGQYSDLSGSRYAIRVFRTYEEARAFLQEKILEILQTERCGTDLFCSALCAVAKNDFQHDEIEKASALFIEYHTERKHNRINQLKEEIAKLEAE